MLSQSPLQAATTTKNITWNHLLNTQHKPNSLIHTYPTICHKWIRLIEIVITVKVTKFLLNDLNIVKGLLFLIERKLE